MKSKFAIVSLSILAVGLLLQITACTTSPTGRKQFIAVGDGQMNQMGAQAFSQMKSEVPLETGTRVNRYVKCIAEKIAIEASDPTGVTNWEVAVFKEDSANAFALPGGKIGVHTGILPMANNQHRLAAVLGHEVGHVIARHGAERVSQGNLLNIGMSAAQIFTGENSENKGMLMAALGLGAQYGVMMPHGRKQESEADVIGLELMAKAGFDPRESITLWQNMARGSGGSPPEFMSTHPSHSTRIDGLRANMDAAMKIYNNARAAGKRPNCG